MKKLLFIFLILFSCSYPEIIYDELVYENDFESNNLNEIDGGIISFFNESNVLGDYNNGGFTIHLDDVKDHDYVFISMDLYIHGSWDGNSNGFKENDKADKWGIEFKPDMDLFKDAESDRFITTFSNSPCWSNYCLKQSFPDQFPFDNNPHTGSAKIDLPKKCENSFFGGKSSLYKVEKVFKSSGEGIVIRIFDELYQPNAIDNFGNSQQKCDESWSVIIWE